MEEATAGNGSRPSQDNKGRGSALHTEESTGPRGWAPDPSGGQWPMGAEDGEGDGDEAGSVQAGEAAHEATAADGTHRPRRVRSMAG